MLHLAVTDKELRVAVVSVPHVYIAVEMIKADIIWVGEVIGSPDAPLADTGSLIACFLKH